MEDNFIITSRIAADKGRIFKVHPRAVSFRWSSRWYQGIRTSAIPEDLDMEETGWNPSTDTVLVINFAQFKDASGDGVSAPDVHARIRMENINWRVEQRIIEADDCKLVLRKEIRSS